MSVSKETLEKIEAEIEANAPKENAEGYYKALDNFLWDKMNDVTQEEVLADLKDEEEQSFSTF